MWPDPALNYDPAAGGSFASWNNPRSIDDFWHTAVNGRGTLLQRQEARICSSPDCAGCPGRRARLALAPEAAITVSNSTPVTGDNFALTTTYTTGKWTGDVQGCSIDVTTGRAVADR